MYLNGQVTTIRLNFHSPIWERELLQEIQMHLHQIIGLALVGQLASPTSAKVQNDHTNHLVIPSWDLQASSQTSANMGQLSQAGMDTSAWYHAPVSRGTTMGCLIAAGEYNQTQLFYSDNLNSVDWGRFLQPWLFRSEFSLHPSNGRHFFLKTNGVTSKADVYVNGKEIADKTTQTGAYGGHTYDITSVADEKNALLIRAYPTDYMYDFAIGFVDWNPYPPDNGTGVWRDVEIRETGPVAMGPLYITTDFSLPVGSSSAKVALKTTVRNLENKACTLAAKASVALDGSDQTDAQTSWTQSVSLGPMESREITLTTTLDNPAFWWPYHWGDQPLYNADLEVSAGGSVSDRANGKFGIRKVTRTLNEHNDTMLTVNGYDFQSRGGGYSSNMFLRWDSDHFIALTRYILDMGLNTLRLEGKMEQPELYEIADRMGLMVMAGWECCDKWEAWKYKVDLTVSPIPVFDENDYYTANSSMKHEAAMMQSHPSMLAFLVGSDFWPNTRATNLYVDALDNASWQNPIICSAAKRGYPERLGPSGMKMPGPYDWVPPNYWYDTEPSEDRLGAAFGFGPELGAGVGTPEMGSLRKFLNQTQMDRLWQKPDANLFHMSTNVSSFYDRSMYNDALWARYGAPSSLENYLLKAQMMDYEATRAEFEGYSSQWNATRPATGVIYWMLNNAWPSLHWNLFDFYLHPGGSYFGTKVGSRQEHVAYDYLHRSVWLINHSVKNAGQRSIEVETLSLDGKTLSSDTRTVDTEPNTSRDIGEVAGIQAIKDVVFLRLQLKDDQGSVLSRNVYWVSPEIDKLNWDNSTWYMTPVTKYADYTSLQDMQTADVSVSLDLECNDGKLVVDVENHSEVPAFFIRLNLIDASGEDVTPVVWSDNFVTLWPREQMQLEVTDFDLTEEVAVEVSGGNIQKSTVYL